VAPGVPVEPLRRTAEKTLATLREHPERFAALARELSNCPSGAQGGALGQLAPGDCVPELDQALFGLTDEGLLPRLVSTRYGFHIVAIDARVPGRRVPFEAVREQIALRLAAEVAERALVQYVSVLAGQARLDDIDLAAAGSPLVQ
jgi:peptidyl-prolyl cis-trans isomerase C